MDRVNTKSRVPRAHNKKNSMGALIVQNIFLRSDRGRRVARNDPVHPVPTTVKVADPPSVSIVTSGQDAIVPPCPHPVPDAPDPVPDPPPTVPTSPFDGRYWRPDPKTWSIE